MPFLIPLLIIIVLYLLSLMCRRGRKRCASLQGWAYAHRGLHGDGVPENSMLAFRKAKEGGYGIELDVHLMADGELAVIHDPSLKRTAGVDVMIEDLTLEKLSDYRLEGTDERIPTFRQVLELYNGQEPLIIELKPERGNHDALAKAVCDSLDGYTGPYCIESFDPRCINWLRKNRPELIRGQLSDDFIHNPSCTLSPAVKFSMTMLVLNFMNRPDFIAYNFAKRKRLGVWLCRNFWGAQGVAWTVRNPEDHAQALKEGWIPIFEGYRP